MPFTVKELTFEVDGEVHSYNPKEWEAHLTLKRPNLDVKSYFTQDTAPKVQDIYQKLVASKDKVMTSIMAMNASASPVAFDLCTLVTPKVSNTTYMKGESVVIERNGALSIVVFMHPVTVTDTTNYDTLVASQHAKIITRPAEGSGSIGD